MKYFKSIATTAAAFLALSEPAFAKKKPKVIYSHPVSTPEQRSADSAACDVKAQDETSDLRVRYYSDPKGGLGSKAAASFGAKAAQGYMQRKEEFKIIEFCLSELGYKKSWLTDDEMTHYKSLKKKQRRAYLNELSQQKRPAETLIDPKLRDEASRPKK